MMDDLLELDSVAKQYFNVSPKIARRKAALGQLPIPAFRLSGVRRGPFYVRKTVLDAWVDACSRRAEALSRQMRLAGAV